MSFWDKILKKKKGETISEVERPLPSELEKFKMERSVSFPERMEPLPEPPLGRPPAEPLPRPIGPARPRAIDKLDLILQKLETIDERLKVIEERLNSLVR